MRVFYTVSWLNFSLQGCRQSPPESKTGIFCHSYQPHDSIVYVVVYKMIVSVGESVKRSLCSTTVGVKKCCFAISFHHKHIAETLHKGNIKDTRDLEELIFKTMLFTLKNALK